MKPHVKPKLNSPPKETTILHWRIGQRTACLEIEQLLLPTKTQGQLKASLKEKDNEK